MLLRSGKVTTTNEDRQRGRYTRRMVNSNQSDSVNPHNMSTNNGEPPSFFDGGTNGSSNRFWTYNINGKFDAYVFHCPHRAYPEFYWTNGAFTNSPIYRDFCLYTFYISKVFNVVEWSRSTLSNANFNDGKLTKRPSSIFRTRDDFSIIGSRFWGEHGSK